MINTNAFFDFTDFQDFPSHAARGVQILQVRECT
jgi:hypothetical protein